MQNNIDYLITKYDNYLVDFREYCYRVCYLLRSEMESMIELCKTARQKESDYTPLYGVMGAILDLAYESTLFNMQNEDTQNEENSLDCMRDCLAKLKQTKIEFDDAKLLAISSGACWELERLTKDCEVMLMTSEMVQALLNKSASN